MGLGAGGKMLQKIYPDKYGAETWDTNNYGTLYVHIINSEMYQAITGREPPPSPIDAKTYTDHGFPWFDLYDEEQGDLKASDQLASVKTVRQKDVEATDAPADEPVKIKKSQDRKIKLT